MSINDGQNLDIDEPSLMVRYCGFARPLNGSCENDGRPTCSNPGPIFQN